MSRALRIAWFGDGPWAAEALRRVHRAGHEVVSVYARRMPSDSSLEAAAQALGLPVCRPARANDEGTITRLRGLSPDLGISVSYDQILRRSMLEIPPLGILNFHAGKLPLYRGRNVINWALINGEHEIGLTAHYMDEGIDTGDIVLQRTLPVAWTDAYDVVLRRVVEQLPALVDEAVDLVATGRATRTPQSGWGTYFAARRPGDEWLAWSDTSVNLHNKIRAISRPAPGARTMLECEEVVVWSAYCDPAWPRYLATPGEVVGRLPDAGVLVKTGDSVLLLKEVQGQDGQCAVPTWPIGTRLHSPAQARARQEA